MKPGEITSMLNNFGHAQLHLNEAAGYAVMVEVRMRLIGQLCEEVRNALVEVVDKYMQDNPKCKRKPKVNYWECDLQFLDDAIDQVFAEKLTSKKRQQIDEFRGLRNKLLHGDFVNLMVLMGIVPTGRVLDPNGKRNVLEEKDLREAILSIGSERNQGFKKIREKAENVISILDELLRIHFAEEKLVSPPFNWTQI